MRRKYCGGGWSFRTREEGGVTLEAAIAMPFFLSFLLAVYCIIRLTIADLALQNAVAETVKMFSAHAYPVKVLAEEARQLNEGMLDDNWVMQTIERARLAREKLIQGEEWADDFRAYIPDHLVHLVDWEREMRTNAEQLAKDEYERLMEERLRPLIRAAFKEALLRYADAGVLKEERLSVVKVDLPSLFDSDKAFLGIEAEYAVTLPIPFMQKTIVLRKKAYERIWTGA
jgi:hypothetical protein